MGGTHKEGTNAEVGGLEGGVGVADALLLGGILVLSVADDGPEVASGCRSRPQQLIFLM